MTEANTSKKPKKKKPVTSKAISKANMSDVVKSSDIISKALKDPEVYRKMAEKEDQYWGRVLSDGDRKEKTKTAQAAAVLLKKNAKMIKLNKFLKENGYKFEHGLVLGCGSGRAERNFIANGICKSFHGVDIAKAAIEDARKIAKKENLKLTYEVADLNQVKLEENAYEFICAQSFLHHILHLDHLVEEMWKALKPNGILWVQDFVGETQFQWSDKRLEITKTIIDLLPEKHKFDKVNNRKIKTPSRPNPGKLCSPFEAIRSGEILPILNKWFDVEHSTQRGSILFHVFPLGVMESYTESEDTRALYNVLMYIDELLVKEKVLPPTGVQLVLKPKKKSNVSKVSTR